MKKFFLVLLLLMISANCFAMNFSQPVQIGKIIYAPTNGIEVENATYASNKPIDKFKNLVTYPSDTLLKFGDDENAIFVHHRSGYKNYPNFGSKNISNSVSVEPGLYGCTIFQLNNDKNIKMYIVRPDEAMAVVLNYTLLGKMNDGTFVKYLSFRDTWNKYVGNNRKNGRPFTEGIHCDKDTVVIEYARYDRGKKIKTGEFRFKWDETAQWFGVEHVVY